MNTSVRLTEQETKIVDYLTAKTSGNVYWEELAQFSKSPQTVKLKTIKRAVSEIRRKYVDAGQPNPFSIQLVACPSDRSIDTSAVVIKQEEPKDDPSTEIDGLYIQSLCNAPVQSVPEQQKLVQIKRMPMPTINKASDGAAIAVAQPTAGVPQAHIDFVLDRNMKRVRTKYGYHLLNDSEWDAMVYVHSNVGKVIPQSELRDKVVYPQYGSKLPARWFEAIGRIIGNLRRQVPGLDKRLLTVKGEETSYLFQ